MKRILLLSFACGVLAAQTIINGSRTILGAWDAGGASTSIPAKKGTSLPGTCTVGEQYFKTDAAAGRNLYFCTATNTWTLSALRVGGIGTVLDNSGTVLGTGVAGYARATEACTIVGWSIEANGASPTMTFDVWKIATGTALPTVANTITAAAKPALATGNALKSTTLTGWTTAVTADDIIGFNLDAVTVATWARLTIFCQK